MLTRTLRHDWFGSILAISLAFHFVLTHAEESDNVSATSYDSLSSYLPIGCDTVYTRGGENGLEAYPPASVYDPDGQIFQDAYRKHDGSVDSYAGQTPTYQGYHPGKSDHTSAVSHYPCCSLAPSAVEKNISYYPRNQSALDNCKALTTSFLHQFKEEHKYHQCGYVEARGGAMSPNYIGRLFVTDYGEVTDAIIIGKGSCVNVYFNVPRGEIVVAPEINSDGGCKHGGPFQIKEFEGHYSRLLQYAVDEQARYGRDAPLRGHTPRNLPPYMNEAQYPTDGFDYLVECECACSNAYHYTSKKHDVDYYGY